MSTKNRTADETPAPRVAAIDQAMQPFVDQGQLSGAVTLVADEDRILHLSAIGRRNLEENLPMETDTIFWVASMTKLMTASSIMMLQEENKLSIEDPVAKYIPQFADLRTPSGKPANLTLRQLITHTSGLAEATPKEARQAHTLGDLIPFYLAKPMQFEPGTQWKYCQSGINTLGHIIEIVSGMSYPDFLKQRIFDPMGMKDATFYPTPEQVQRLAVSYKMEDGKLTPTEIGLIAGAISDHNRYPAANGGLFITAEEYCRFCQMLLDGGTLDGRRYLQAQSIGQMTSNQTDDLPSVGFIPGSRWGLGFGIVSEPTGITAMLSRGTFGHGGAYGTQAWIDPVRKRIYILMIQRADLPNSDASEFRRAFQTAAAQ